MQEKSVGEALRSVFGPFAKLLTGLIAVGCLVALGAGILLIPTAIRNLFYDETNPKNAVTVTVLDPAMQCSDRFRSTLSRATAYPLYRCQQEMATQITFIPKQHNVRAVISRQKGAVFKPVAANTPVTNGKYVWRFNGPDNAVLVIHKNSKQVIESYIYR